MGWGADVGEQIAQAALAKPVNIERQRSAEPRNADDLAAGANGFDRLREGAATSQALLGAAAGAFENDVGAVAAGQVVNLRDRIALRSVDGMVGAKVARDAA